MLSSRVRLPAQQIFNIVSRSVSTKQSTKPEKIFAVKRKRPVATSIMFKDHQIRLEWAQPEDVGIITDFMNEVVVKGEPSGKSTGAPLADTANYIETLLKNGGLKYTMLAVDGDRILGSHIALPITLDRSKTAKPEPVKDYGEMIDSCENEYPNRSFRRLMVPLGHLLNMVPNFVPDDVKQVFRFDLACVQKSASGHDIGTNIFIEQLKAGYRDGFKYGDAQTAAMGSWKVLEKVGAKTVISLKYDQMFDHGERIHKKVPLIDGSEQINLHVFTLESAMNNLAKLNSAKKSVAK